ncbi:MAG: sodium:proton antiporter [Anaerolineae bacterium]|nr:sodium:proton antiporter [Thermoflexales bacterium]MDW8406633.1 sodium:proton antiporter [Anaerolineae bacterium]
MIELFTALAISALFAIGVFQLLRRNLIRSAMGVAIVSNAINLFLLASGAYRGEVAAYANLAGQTARQPSDALPQALILTAIVIGMGAFAVVLALVYVLSLRYKTSDSDEVKGLRH